MPDFTEGCCAAGAVIKECPKVANIPEAIAK
jgi:hypothetical protein